MKMKRIFAAALSMCLALTLLAGCQSGGDASSGGGSTGGSSTGGSSQAETLDWPKDNINLIVPFAAGGGMDLTGRLIGQYLEKELGVTVTINNVEGGNSWTGWTQVIQAEGNGYTLGMANYPQCVGGYLNPSSGIPFTYEDFSYIANIVSDPNVLWVSANHSDFTTAQEFFDYAKDNTVVLGTGGGAGCDDDVLIAKVNDALGLSIESGRNSGFSEAKTAVLGGHIDGAVSNVSEVYSMIGSTGDDAIHILCIFSEERNELCPDVPTFEECGYPQVLGASDRGLVGPADLDPAIIDYLVEVIQTIDTNEEFHNTAIEQGMTINFMYGDDFEAYVASVEETMNGMLELFGWA